MIGHYKDIDAYQRSYSASVEVYQIARSYPKEEIYGMASQMKRASSSIPLNLAEGWGKRMDADEFKRFIKMAIGSCDEMRSLLDFGKDLGFIEEETHKRLCAEYDEIGKMLNALHQRWKKFK